MSLVSLPYELLGTILEYVGVEEFQANVSRLTVCQRWHKIASLMVLQRVVITERWKPFPCRVIELLQENLCIIDFKIPPCDFWGNTRSLWWKSISAGVAIPLLDMEAIKDLTLACLDMDQDLLKTCRKLHTIRIRGKAEIYSGVPSILFAFTQTPTPKQGLTFVTTPLTLTEIHFDLCGPGIKKDTRITIDHMCETISKLLPFLRRLWIRKPHICPEDLRLWPDHQSIPLESLIINLVLPSENLCDVPLTAYDCGSMFTPFFEPVKVQDIIHAASCLAERAPHARLIRVLHLSDGYEGEFRALHAFDVLTGLDRRLAHDAEWDDDPARYLDQTFAQDDAIIRQHRDSVFREQARMSEENQRARTKGESLTKPVALYGERV